VRSLSASEDENCSDDRSIAIEFDKPPSPHGAPVRHSQIQHDLSELRALAAMGSCQECRSGIETIGRVSLVTCARGVRLNQSRTFADQR
jgi:hypothetical protein